MTEMAANLPNSVFSLMGISLLISSLELVRSQELKGGQYLPQFRFSTDGRGPLRIRKYVYVGSTTKTRKKYIKVPCSVNFGTPCTIRFSGQFPYQVSVRRLVLLSWRHRCGGSLISKNWVLTTASCTQGAWFLREGIQGVAGSYHSYDIVSVNRAEPFPLQVAAGKNDLRVVEDGEQLMKVSKTIIHHNFTPE